MTWTNVPWALDGALIPSSLARLGQYVATGGAEGIAQLGDLKVAPLDTPGNGVKIFSGGAAVLNRYQGETPDQTYMVHTASGEILGPSDMPASSGSALSHLVCVTVGDPEFSQTGHPWMLSSDPPVGTEDTFQYVRTFVVQNVPSNTVSFDQLNLNYPAYALARLDVPASTTTITSGMIVDLREMASPRSKDFQWSVAASVADVLVVTTPGVFEYWPDNSQSAVPIPKWASYAYVDGWINGFVDSSSDATKAEMRIGSLVMNVYTPSSKYSAIVAGRESVLMGGRIYIPSAYRGTTQNWQIHGTPQDAGSQSDLTTDAWTNCMVHIRFVEEPD